MHTSKKELRQDELKGPSAFFGGGGGGGVGFYTHTHTHTCLCDTQRNTNNWFAAIIALFTVLTSGPVWSDRKTVRVTIIFFCYMTTLRGSLSKYNRRGQWQPNFLQPQWQAVVTPSLSSRSSGHTGRAEITHRPFKLTQNHARARRHCRPAQPFPLPN